MEELQSFVEVELGVSALDLGTLTLAQLPDPSPTGLQIPLIRDMTVSMMEQAGGLTKLFVGCGCRRVGTNTTIHTHARTH